MDETERLLTKADILEGKEKREKVFIKKLDGYLEIRPLTEIEWARVQAMNARGMSMTTKIDPKEKDKHKDFDMVIDMGKSSEANSEAERLVVLYGVVSIDLTLEDVGKLKPAGVVGEIADHILRITGVSLKKTKKEKAEEVQSKVEVVSSFCDK